MWYKNCTGDYLDLSKAIGIMVVQRMEYDYVVGAIYENQSYILEKGFESEAEAYVKLEEIMKEAV